MTTPVYDSPCILLMFSPDMHPVCQPALMSPAIQPSFGLWYGRMLCTDRQDGHRKFLLIIEKAKEYLGLPNIAGLLEFA